MSTSMPRPPTDRRIVFRHQSGLRQIMGTCAQLGSPTTMPQTVGLLENGQPLEGLLLRQTPTYVLYTGSADPKGQGADSPVLTSGAL